MLEKQSTPNPLIVRNNASNPTNDLLNEGGRLQPSPEVAEVGQDAEPLTFESGWINLIDPMVSSATDSPLDQPFKKAERAKKGLVKGDTLITGCQRRDWWQANFAGGIKKVEKVRVWASDKYDYDDEWLINTARVTIDDQECEAEKYGSNSKYVDYTCYDLVTTSFLKTKNTVKSVGAKGSHVKVTSRTDCLSFDYVEVYGQDTIQPGIIRPYEVYSGFKTSYGDNDEEYRRAMSIFPFY